MPRRDTAALAEMSWPRLGRNRWFDRRWTDPPDARSRTRGPARGQDVIGKTASGNDRDNNATPGPNATLSPSLVARAAAERLFRPHVVEPHQ
jgi:hypothetical protein